MILGCYSYCRMFCFLGKWFCLKDEILRVTRVPPPTISTCCPNTRSFAGWPTPLWARSTIGDLSWEYSGKVGYYYYYILLNYIIYIYVSSSYYYFYYYYCCWFELSLILWWLPTIIPGYQQYCYLYSGFLLSFLFLLYTIYWVISKLGYTSAILSINTIRGLNWNPVCWMEYCIWVSVGLITSWEPMVRWFELRRCVPDPWKKTPLHPESKTGSLNLPSKWTPDFAPYDCSMWVTVKNMPVAEVWLYPCYIILK